MVTDQDLVYLAGNSVYHSGKDNDGVVEINGKLIF